MAETDEPGVFAAPDMQYLMDSPIEISDFVLREWTVGEGDEAQAFRLALHHAGTEEEADAYGRLAETVVREQAALWGELPRFDHGQYTFLADYLPYSDGDGMEHRNSTVLSSSRSLADAPIRLLRTLSHEFFHAWNVERIRPRSLEPFDFERENMSGELWFAEGFTNYYDGLVLCRAGIVDLDGYAEDISGTVNAVMNTPATRYGSPVDMSLRAPLVDGATWVDPQNLGNIFLTYYTFGDAVGLALDLTLRTRTEKTLDDFLRAVWEKYGREETPYTNADLEATLAEVTGDEEFAKGFFTRYVYGREVADYGSLLAAAGLVLRKENEGAASWGGARLTKGDGGVEVGGPPPVDSPLYRAGAEGAAVSAGDGREVARRVEMEELREGYAPGAEVKVDYRQRGRELTAMVTLDEDRTVEVVPVEHLGETPSEAAVAFRESWLGSKSGYVDASLGRRCPTCQRRYPMAHAYCGHDGKELVIAVAE